MKKVLGYYNVNPMLIGHGEFLVNPVNVDSEKPIVTEGYYVTTEGMYYKTSDGLFYKVKQE